MSLQLGLHVSLPSYRDTIEDAHLLSNFSLSNRDVETLMWCTRAPCNKHIVVFDLF